MKHSLAPIALVALIALAAVGFAWWAAAPPLAPAGPPAEITVGKMAIPAHALLYIARDRGYFAENGLAVTFREYGTGPAAMDALRGGEVDVAASGEYVVVQQAFDRAPIRLVACIDRYEFFSLAARRDRGIANASDLAGRTIGVGRRSNADFFLGRFLDLHGIALTDVTLVDVPPPQWADAVGNGSVDAVVFNHDRRDAVAAALGENAVTMPVQNDQPLYSVLACRDAWVADHPGTVGRFLRALDQADRYAAAHPDDLRAALQTSLNLTPGEVDAVLRENRFALSLDRSMVTAMKDEARWMIQNNLTNATAVPDFREFVSTAAFEQVRPEAPRVFP